MITADMSDSAKQEKTYPMPSLVMFSIHAYFINIEPKIGHPRPWRILAQNSYTLNTPSGSSLFSIILLAPFFFYHRYPYWGFSFHMKGIGDLRFLLSIETREWFLKGQDVQWIC